MLPAPLQLNSCQIRTVHLATSPDTPNSDAVTITVTPTYGRNNLNTREWLVTLKVLFRAPEGSVVPYSGEIEVQGVFTVPTECPADKVNKIVAVTCPSVLYGTVRELVASLTGRGVHGAFLLPMVSFADHDLVIDPPAEPASASIPDRTTASQKAGT